jgi:hypothetical protein
MLFPIIVNSGLKMQPNVKGVFQGFRIAAAKMRHNASLVNRLRGELNKYNLPLAIGRDIIPDDERGGIMQSLRGALLKHL